MDSIITWVFIGGAIVLISIQISISQMRTDIARINKNLNEIAKQVGVPDTITDELRNLILEGKKIEAVKKYRLATGAGLLEAKEYVESLTELK